MISCSGDRGLAGWENYFGRLKPRRSVRVAQQKNTSQDAQKGGLLTRPTLARQDAPCPRQGRSSAADPRFTFHASRFSLLWNEARTKLTDFLSIFLGVEQVLYRCPNRVKPCFSRRLCPEELNRLIHLPTASHKIERHGMAKKRLTDWLCLGSAAEETVDPIHSILSVDAG